jgi:hypothetical protein
MRATKIANVPTSVATLSIAKKSSKVSFDMVQSV